jgi:flavin-dependent dehydrogenase
MSRTIETQVLIVGAGPVGLTLAIDLAWRGIDVTVAEQRRAGEPPRIRSNHVSARTMEIFRRLGVADSVRRAGLPDDFPNAGLALPEPQSAPQRRGVRDRRTRDLDRAQFSP